MGAVSVSWLKNSLGNCNLIKVSNTLYFIYKKWEKLNLADCYKTIFSVSYTF